MKKQIIPRNAPGLAVFVGKSFGRLSGLSFGQSLLMQSLSPLKHWLDRLLCLRTNRLNASQLSKLPFSEIKKYWGIVQASDEALFCQSQRYALLGGLALFVFGLVICLLAHSPSQLLTLAWRLAALSASLLGIIICASSLWRLSCIKHRRFIPISLWLRRR